MGEVFSIHPLTVEDIQEAAIQETREKIERYENYAFITTKTPSFPSDDGKKFPGIAKHFVDMQIVAFQTRIISIHKQPLGIIRECYKRLVSISKPNDLSGNWILYTILDAVSDEYLPIVNSINKNVNDIEDSVLFCVPDSLHEKDLQLNPREESVMRSISTCKKTVTAYHRLLQERVGMLNEVIKKGLLTESIQFYLRDVLDHALQMYQQLQHQGESLERCRNTYAMHLSLELADSSNRLSLVMKRLAAATFLIMPLNLIASIWGMNVGVPGGIHMPGTVSSSFYIILAGMAIALLPTIFLAKRLGVF